MRASPKLNPASGTPGVPVTLADHAPAPTAPAGRTCTSYRVPFVSPAIVALVTPRSVPESSVQVSDCATARYRATYPSTTVATSSDGTVQLTVNCRSPGTRRASRMPAPLGLRAGQVANAEPRPLRIDSGLELAQGGRYRTAQAVQNEIQMLQIREAAQRRRDRTAQGVAGEVQVLQIREATQRRRDRTAQGSVSVVPPRLIGAGTETQVLQIHEAAQRRWNRTTQLVVAEIQAFQSLETAQGRRERTAQEVGAESQRHHAAVPIRSHAVPLMEWCITVPIRAAQPVRTVGGVVELDEHGPVVGGDGRSCRRRAPRTCRPRTITGRVPRPNLDLVRRSVRQTRDRRRRRRALRAVRQRRPRTARRPIPHVVVVDHRAVVRRRRPARCQLTVPRPQPRGRGRRGRRHRRPRRARGPRTVTRRVPRPGPGPRTSCRSSDP